MVGKFVGLSFDDERSVEGRFDRRVDAGNKHFLHDRSAPCGGVAIVQGRVTPVHMHTRIVLGEEGVDVCGFGLLGGRVYLAGIGCKIYVWPRFIHAQVPTRARRPVPAFYATLFEYIWQEPLHYVGSRKCKTGLWRASHNRSTRRYPQQTKHKTPKNAPDVAGKTICLLLTLWLNLGSCAVYLLFHHDGSCLPPRWKLSEPIWAKSGFDHLRHIFCSVFLNLPRSARRFTLYGRSRCTSIRKCKTELSHNESTRRYPQRIKHKMPKNAPMWWGRRSALHAALWLGVGQSAYYSTMEVVGATTCRRALRSSLPYLLLFVF